MERDRIQDIFEKMLYSQYIDREYVIEFIQYVAVLEFENKQLKENNNQYFKTFTPGTRTFTQPNQQFIHHSPKTNFDTICEQNYAQENYLRTFDRKFGESP